MKALIIFSAALLITCFTNVKADVSSPEQSSVLTPTSRSPRPITTGETGVSAAAKPQSAIAAEPHQANPGQKLPAESLQRGWHTEPSSSEQQVRQSGEPVMALADYWRRMLEYLRSIPDAQERAIAVAASQIFSSWPTKLSTERIAVLTLHGDEDGRISDGLARELHARCPNCRLYDRKNLDQILKEWELQAGEMVKKDTQVRLGEMIGAEVLILGQVNFYKRYWEFAQLSISVQADDVQSGAIVWKPQEAMATVASPLFTLAAIAMILVLAIILFFLIRGRRRRQFVVEAPPRLEKIRIDVVAESLKKTRNNLKAIRDKAMDGNRMDLAKTLKTIELSADTLERRVKAAATGMAENLTSRDVHQAESLIVEINDRLGDLNRSLERLYEHAAHGQWEPIAGAAPSLQTELNRLQNRYNDLKQYL